LHELVEGVVDAALGVGELAIGLVVVGDFDLPSAVAGQLGVAAVLVGDACEQAVVSVGVGGGVAEGIRAVPELTVGGVVEVELSAPAFELC